MKKYLAAMLFICIAAFLFSGSAFASLSPGTYGIAQGIEQNGTWYENLLGGIPAYPGFDGSTVNISSVPSQWAFSGNREPATIHELGRGYNGLFYVDYGYAIGQGSFTFTIPGDSTTYTVNTLTGTGQYRLNFSAYDPNNLLWTMQHYMGATNIVWIGEGLVSGTNLKVSVTAKGYETYNNLVGWNPTGVNSEHGGIVTFAEGTVSAPIPGALWLLGSGLLGLLGIRRRAR